MLRKGERCRKRWFDYIEWTVEIPYEGSTFLEVTSRDLILEPECSACGHVCE